jgi:phosphatidylserine/phosphatidylglycerophosphate/cardiolipin synthase-like enzyme
MPSQAGEQYSGSDSYRFVDRLINSKGSELLVVSPYIDNYYARALLRASRRRRVRIVTSPDAIAHRDSFLRSIRMQRMKGYAEATVYFVLLSAIALYLRFYCIAAPVVALALAAFALMLRSRHSTAIQLKVIRDRFVHEKLYISNGTAVIGSANLTYSGMHKNIEHVEMIRNGQEVDALKRHFEELWSRE